MLSGVSRPLSNLPPQTSLLQYYTTVFSKVGNTMFFHMVALCCPCAFPSDSAFVALGLPFGFPLVSLWYQSNQRETKGKPKGNQEGEPGTNQRQDKGEPKKNERETKRKPKGHQRETKGQPKGNESGIS